MSTNLPNLVSFPSWEYDVASAISSSGYVASAASFDVSVSTAGGGINANSHVIPSISSMSTFTVSTVGSTNVSGARVKEVPAVATRDAAAQHRASTSVEVHVSGCKFTIPAATYAKLRVLPWEGSRGNTLRTCPKLFEIILNHLLFDTFPDVRSLSVSDVEELEPMAILLELNGLVDHLLAHRHKARLDGNDGRKLFSKGTKAPSDSTGPTIASRIFRSRKDNPPSERKQDRVDSARVSRPSHKKLLRASSCPSGGNSALGTNTQNRKLLWTARAQWRARQNTRTAACEWNKVVHSVHSETLDKDSPWMEIHRTLS